MFFDEIQTLFRLERAVVRCEVKRFVYAAVAVAHVIIVVEPVLGFRSTDNDDIGILDCGHWVQMFLEDTVGYHSSFVNYQCIESSTA